MRLPCATLVALLLAPLVGLAPVGCARSGEADTDADAGARPHVIVISIDTLRADHLGCYGYERATSPRIDVLARDAVLYENGHSHSNSTAPSHVTLLSGVLPPAHGVKHREARGPSPDVPMLAELFAAAGWRTAAFADGGFLTAPFGFARGFEVFDSRLERLQAKLERIEAWLDAADDRPTFLFVHTYGVHAPYLPAVEHDRFTDPAYDGPLAARVGALRALEGPDGRWPPFEQTKDAFWEGRGTWDARDRDYLVGLYDGCLHEVDAGIGVLLDALERKGWLDEAWVVLTSDHGEAFGEHGTHGHRQLHEAELHVPLLVRPPGGVAGGVRVEAEVGLSAVAPTLLRAAGLPVPAAMQDRPLSPLEAPGDRAVLAQGADAARYLALIEGGHKLLAKGGEQRALFDLRADPDERTDLLSPSGQASGASHATRQRLEHLLDEIEERCRTLRARLGEPVEERGLDPEQEEALRALGYVR